MFEDESRCLERHFEGHQEDAADWTRGLFQEWVGPAAISAGRQGLIASRQVITGPLAVALIEENGESGEVFRAVGFEQDAVNVDVQQLLSGNSRGMLV